MNPTPFTKEELKDLNLDCEMESGLQETLARLEATLKEPKCGPAAHKLWVYAYLKLGAMRARLAGWIWSATSMEAFCDAIYATLSDEHRW